MATNATSHWTSGHLAITYREARLEIDTRDRNNVKLSTHLSGIHMEDYTFTTVDEALSWAETFLDGFMLAEENSNGEVDNFRQVH